MPKSVSPRRRVRLTSRPSLWWLLAGAAALLLGGGGWAYHQLSGGSLGSVDIETAVGTARPPASPDGGRGILVVGTDSGARVSASDEPQGPGSLLVVRLAANGDNAMAVGLPEELAVRPARCAQPQGDAPVGRLTLSEVYLGSGAGCLVGTVEQLSGFRMDHYIEVDFAGSEALVDALGGVRLSDPPGAPVLSGQEALAAVRAEQQPAAGEDELSPQQRLLVAIIRQLNERDVLASPATLYELATAANKALTTDSGLGTLSDLASFAKELSGTDIDALTTVALPTEREAGGAVVSQPQADTVWQAMRDDERSSAP